MQASGQYPGPVQASGQYPGPVQASGQPAGGYPGAGQQPGGHLGPYQGSAGPYPASSGQATGPYPASSGQATGPYPGQTPSLPGPSASPPGPSAPPRRRTLLLVVTAVVVLGLLGGVVFMLVSRNSAASPGASASPTVTRSPTPGRGWQLSGTTLTGTSMTATVPSGWSLSKDNGASNDGEIIDDHKNLITYRSFVSHAPDAACRGLAESVRGSQNEEVKPLPAVSWDGRPTVGYEITLKRPSLPEREAFTFYCIENRAGGSTMLLSVAWERDAAAVRRSLSELMGSWKWTS